MLSPRWAERASAHQACCTTLDGGAFWHCVFVAGSDFAFQGAGAVTRSWICESAVGGGLFKEDSP